MNSSYIDPIEKIQRMMSKCDPTTRPVWDYDKEIAPNARVDTLDAVQVASELTMLESELYLRVTREECMAFASTGPSGALAEIIDTERRLGAWVLHSILELDDLWLRASVTDRWIAIAHKCRKLGNCASSLIIMDALAFPGLKRLHKTNSQIYGNVPRAEMDELFDPADDYARIRGILATDGTLHLCVPSLDPYVLRFPDETFVDQYLRKQRYSDEVDPDAKYVSGPAYSLKRKKFIAAHIKHRLAEAEGPGYTEAWFRSRALELEQAEAAIIW